jgi:hypothetical protein
MKTGGCLCGAVRYEIDTIPDSFRACHCSQCRKVSGYYWAAFSVPDDQFRLTEARGLKWFKSSGWASRGFCADCGSALFYKMDDHATTEVSPGSIDGPTGTRVAGHIYVADKGDYYELTDDLPQRQD